jgi:hypothetical protein
MELVVLYLLMSYAGAFIGLGLLWHLVLLNPEARDPVRRRRPLLHAFIASIGIVVLPVTPYLYVELLTRAEGSALEPVTRDTLDRLGYGRDVLAIKVLASTPSFKRVYAVSRYRSRDFQSDDGVEKVWHRGNVVEFTVDNRTVEFHGVEDVVWAEQGSADGNIFPPYPTRGFY